jgi:hypothetical protein
MVSTLWHFKGPKYLPSTRSACPLSRSTLRSTKRVLFYSFPKLLYETYYETRHIFFKENQLVPTSIGTRHGSTGRLLWGNMILFAYASEEGHFERAGSTEYRFQIIGDFDMANTYDCVFSLKNSALVYWCASILSLKNIHSKLELLNETLRYLVMFD